MNVPFRISPDKEMSQHETKDHVGPRWSSGLDNQISNVRQVKFETSS